MRKKGREESPTFLRKKKKSDELTKGSTGPSSSGPLPSTVTRHPLPSSGNAIGEPVGLGLLFL
jgi:hypothetical protein